MMKSRFKIWSLCVMMALLGVTCLATNQQHTMSDSETTRGELKSNDEPAPISHDGCPVLNAPAQLPTIVPSQSSRLVTPAKYRTTLMRTNILRRSANRLCDNIYTPLALSGLFIVERVSAPVRNFRAVYYYVITLCRLLC